MFKNLIVMCAWCKRIRNDKGHWQHPDAHITKDPMLPLRMAYVRIAKKSAEKRSNRYWLNNMETLVRLCKVILRHVFNTRDACHFSG